MLIVFTTFDGLFHSSVALVGEPVFLQHGTHQANGFPGSLCSQQSVGYQGGRPVIAASADNSVVISQFGLHTHILDAHTQAMFVDTPCYAISQMPRSGAAP